MAKKPNDDGRKKTEKAIEIIANVLQIITAIIAIVGFLSAK